MDDKDNLRKNNVVGGGDSQDYLRGNIAPSALPNNSNSRLQKATSQTKAPRRRKISRAHIIGLIGFLVVVATFVALILTGAMYVGFKEPAEKVVVKHIVCDQKIIDRYNNSTEVDQFVALAKEIDSKAGYKKDPTCLYIVFNSLSRRTSGNYKKMEEALNNIQNMHNEGVFPNSNIRDMQSIDEMKTLVNDVKNIENDPNYVTAEGVG